jgi:hypothetical protein
MDRFYIIVLSIAVIFLILTLTFAGIAMNGKSTAIYPPVLSTCPDTWLLSTTDQSSCIIPLSTGANTGNIYQNGVISAQMNTNTTPGFNSSTNSIQFSDPGWSAGLYAGNSSVCAQKAWAYRFNVHWDGVSNYNSC